MNLEPQLIVDALKHVRYPGNGNDIVSLGILQPDIRIEGKKIFFSLLFEKPNDSFTKSVVKASEQAINLLTLMKAIYRPITKEDYDNLQKRRRETRDK